MQLANQLAMLPTPQAMDGNGEGRPLRMKRDMPRDPDRPGSWRGDLKDHIAMLPTPRASDSAGGVRSNDGTARISKTTGRRFGLNLSDKVA